MLLHSQSNSFNDGFSQRGGSIDHRFTKKGTMKVGGYSNEDIGHMLVGTAALPILGYAGYKAYQALKPKKWFSKY